MQNEKIGHITRLLLDAATLLGDLNQREASLEKKLDGLRTVIKQQTSDGNWNYDHYNHGIANGLLIAQGIINGQEPKLLSAPKQFIADRVKNETRATEQNLKGSDGHGAVRSGERRINQNDCEAVIRNPKISGPRQDS